MAWTKLKDIFATKKEINEVRDSLSQIGLGVQVESLNFISWSGANEIWFHTKENKTFVIIFPAEVNEKLRIVEKLQDGTEKQIRSI